MDPACRFSNSYLPFTWDEAERKLRESDMTSLKSSIMNYVFENGNNLPLYIAIFPAADTILRPSLPRVQLREVYSA
jgi:hypothetical protein